MLIRYDFIGDKLNLTLFEKQLLKNLSKITSSFLAPLYLDLYFKDYVIEIEIKYEKSFNYRLAIYDLVNSYNGEPDLKKSIFPADDVRLKEIPEMKIFQSGEYETKIENVVQEQVVKDIIRLTKLFYKINTFKAYF
jgi:hypothetical protein